MRFNSVRPTARVVGMATLACGIAGWLAATPASGRDIDGGRGPAPKGERPGASVTTTQTTAPVPPPPGGGFGASGNPFPGPVRFPGEIRPMNPVPGPNNTSSGSPSGGASLAPAGPASILAAPAGRAMPTIAPSGQATHQIIPPGPDAAPAAAATTLAPGSTTATGRITEIIPDASLAARRDPSPTRPSAALATATAEPCVSLFLRRSKVDGRDVVSVDLHGDGLIKGAVPRERAGDLLARAGPESAAGVRAVCVPATVARTFFDPVVNVAAVDPAVRMARVGDRWVLAGSNTPVLEPPAQPLRVAAATTRGAPKSPAKKAAPQAKPRAAPPQQPAYVLYP